MAQGRGQQQQAGYGLQSLSFKSIWGGKGGKKDGSATTQAAKLLGTFLCHATYWCCREVAAWKRNSSSLPQTQDDHQEALRMAGVRDEFKEAMVTTLWLKTEP